MLRSRNIAVITILLALAVTAYAPSLISGLLGERAGLAAVQEGEYARAAAEFGMAAPKLAWKPKLWEMAGLAAYQSGDHVTAVQLLQTARERGVLSSTGWEVLGSSLWAAGSPGAAVNTWLAGTDAHPAAAELWDRLAEAFHAQRDYVGEQAALQRRLEMGQDAAAQYRLALLLIGRDDQGAVEALDTASRLDANVGPARTTLRAAIAASNAEAGDSARLVVIGRSLGLVDEWALAARSFGEAVQRDAKNAEARAWLGEARQHIDEDGRSDLDAALSLEPDNSIVHTLRGLYWRRNNNPGLSLAEYTRAVQLDPRNAGLQALLGEAYAFSGDLVAALEAYQTAVELAPGESAYWRLLARFSADNEVQVLDLGVAAGLQAVELAPQDAQALDALGWAYAQAGYLIKAEEALLKALEIAPQYGGAHLHLGITYLRWGQNDLAREHLAEAVGVDPGGAAGESALKLLQTYYPQ
jgi:tetratricopeptide (TPR) repeat protein